ncbi:MAG: hypothetical protein U0U70_14615 [Chitinophagaceae bacterium]
MRILLATLSVLAVTTAAAQAVTEAPRLPQPFHLAALPGPAKGPGGDDDIQLAKAKWKLTSNHLWTGGLVFMAGAAKGFNETLQFHWKEFKRQFPSANPHWFNPMVSWKNKYKNGDPAAGPKSFLSTSVLIMFTDQYHLNNFLIRMSWASALVIKIGEKKKPFRQYLWDFLYYSACNFAGFASTYYPFSKYRGK